MHNDLSSCLWLTPPVINWTLTSSLRKSGPSLISCKPTYWRQKDLPTLEFPDAIVYSEEGKAEIFANSIKEQFTEASVIPTNWLLSLTLFLFIYSALLESAMSNNHELLCAMKIESG